MIMTNFQFERMISMFARCLDLGNWKKVKDYKRVIVLAINNFLNAMEIDNVRAYAVEKEPYIMFETAPIYKGSKFDI